MPWEFEFPFPGSLVSTFPEQQVTPTLKVDDWDSSQKLTARRLALYFFSRENTTTTTTTTTTRSSLGKYAGELHVIFALRLSIVFA